MYKYIHRTLYLQMISTQCIYRYILQPMYMTRIRLDMESQGGLAGQGRHLSHLSYQDTVAFRAELLQLHVDIRCAM